MCCAHANSSDECPLLFRTGPHTHKHGEPHMHSNTLPNTHRLTRCSRSHSDTRSPMCCDKFLKTPKAPRQKRWKYLTLQRSFITRICSWLKWPHQNLGSPCRCFSPSIPPRVDRVKETEPGLTYLCCHRGWKKGIYLKKSPLFQRRAAASRSRRVALRCTTHWRNLNHSNDSEKAEFCIFIRFPNLTFQHEYRGITEHAFMNYFHESGAADVFSDKAEPHMEMLSFCRQPANSLKIILQQCMWGANRTKTRNTKWWEGGELEVYFVESGQNSKAVQKTA